MSLTKSDLSPEALEVWDSLSEKQKATIRKDNPFPVDRNSEIRSLRERGVKITVLAEITGLGRNSIIRISDNNGKLHKSAFMAVQSSFKNLKQIVQTLEYYISRLQ